MSYEIYYKKAFIKVGDKIIPVLQHGSNNCFEVTWNNREIAEKNWSNWTFTKEGRGSIICDALQIINYAKEFSRPSSFGDMPFKARGRQFEEVEAYRWFFNGMRTARTVEEYTALGNTVKVYAYIDNGKTNTYTVKTTEELLSMLEVMKNDNPWVGFVGRDLHLPKKEVKIRPKKEVDHFWAIYIEGYGYLRKRTSGKIYSTTNSDYAKKFKTAEQAQKVMEQIAPKYDYITFCAKKVEEKAMI